MAEQFAIDLRVLSWTLLRRAERLRLTAHSPISDLGRLRQSSKSHFQQTDGRGPPPRSHHDPHHPVRLGPPNRSLTWLLRAIALPGTPGIALDLCICQLSQHEHRCQCLPFACGH